MGLPLLYTENKFHGGINNLRSDLVGSVLIPVICIV